MKKEVDVKCLIAIVYRLGQSTIDHFIYLPKMKFFFLFCFYMLMLSCHSSTQKKSSSTVVTQETTVEADGLNRHPVAIHYSKHARCRMECRHINEAEVKGLLESGEINYKKSELNGDACHQKYAVEGYIQNNHLRVIFAPCSNTITVVTCIDLDHEWSCDCPGDHH